MREAPYEPASDKAINELAKALRPVVESAEGELDLQQILACPKPSRPSRPGA